jgi:hypothetical protein
MQVTTRRTEALLRMTMIHGSARQRWFGGVPELTGTRAGSATTAMGGRQTMCIPTGTWNCSRGVRHARTNSLITVCGSL